MLPHPVTVSSQTLFFLISSLNMPLIMVSQRILCTYMQKQNNTEKVRTNKTKQTPTVRRVQLHTQRKHVRLSEAGWSRSSLKDCHRFAQHLELCQAPCLQCTQAIACHLFRAMTVTNNAKEIQRNIVFHK